MKKPKLPPGKGFGTLYKPLFDYRKLLAGKIALTATKITVRGKNYDLCFPTPVSKLKKINQFAYEIACTHKNIGLSKSEKGLLVWAEDNQESSKTWRLHTEGGSVATIWLSSDEIEGIENSHKLFLNTRFLKQTILRLVEDCKPGDYPALWLSLPMKFVLEPGDPPSDIKYNLLFVLNRQSTTNTEIEPEEVSIVPVSEIPSVAKRVFSL